MSGGAAVEKPGLLPRDVSAASVNCDIINTDPATSFNDKFILPMSSLKIRSLEILAANLDAVEILSPFIAQMKINKP